MAKMAGALTHITLCFVFLLPMVVCDWSDGCDCNCGCEPRIKIKKPQSHMIMPVPSLPATHKPRTTMSPATPSTAPMPTTPDEAMTTASVCEPSVIAQTEECGTESLTRHIDGSMCVGLIREEHTWAEWVDSCPGAGVNSFPTSDLELAMIMKLLTEFECSPDRTVYLGAEFAIAAPGWVDRDNKEDAYINGKNLAGGAGDCLGIRADTGLVIIRCDVPQWAVCFA